MKSWQFLESHVRDKIDKGAKAYLALCIFGPCEGVTIPITPLYPDYLIAIPKPYRANHHPDLEYPFGLPGTRTIDARLVSVKDHLILVPAAMYQALSPRELEAKIFTRLFNRFRVVTLKPTDGLPWHEIIEALKLDKEKCGYGWQAKFASSAGIPEVTLRSWLQQKSTPTYENGCKAVEELKRRGFWMSIEELARRVNRMKPR